MCGILCHLSPKTKMLVFSLIRVPHKMAPSVLDLNNTFLHEGSKPFYQTRQEQKSCLLICCTHFSFLHASPPAHFIHLILLSSFRYRSQGLMDINSEKYCPPYHTHCAPSGDSLWDSAFFIGLSPPLGFGCLDMALESLEQWSPKWGDHTPGMSEIIHWGIGNKCHHE